MKLTVYNFDNKALKELEIDGDLAEQPFRPDILHRVVEWQRSKRRSGTHATKGISQISGTTKKPYKQKGTGNARQGSLRSPQFRGGAVIFGPVVRSHEYSLPKKVRKLGLKLAISQKLQGQHVKLVDHYPTDVMKTVNAAEKLSHLVGDKKTLVIYNGAEHDSFMKTVRNLQTVNILPACGLNVYDILKHDMILLCESTFNAVQERLK